MEKDTVPVQHQYLKLLAAGPSTASISEADLLAAGPSTASISEADLLAAGPSTASISEANLLAAGPSTASVPYHIPNVELNISDNNTDGEAVSYILSKAHSTDMLQLDKAAQVNCKVPHRSKGVNVNLTVKKNNIALSPFPIPSRNTSTSPLKSAQSSPIKRKLFTDNPADSASLTSVNSQYSVISTDYEPESSSDSSWLIEDELDSDIQFKNLMHSGTLIAIEKEPKLFLVFRESPVPSDPEHNIEKLSVLLKDVFDDKSEYMELEKMDDIKINNEEINENLDPNIIAYINISSSVKSVTAPSPVQIQKIASPAPSSPLIHQTPTPVPSPVQIHELCNSSFCVQCPEDIILIAPDDLYGNLPTPSVSSIANSATPTFTKGIKKRTYKNDKGKKRLVHKEDWIVTKSKLLKNQGKTYTNQ
ncbi:unnamed protein product [Arctia plantaginis]|uniref:Uncharacterized protein n=1 Tax=Arctia plantaginis TaxID=874455 RepID=A0A8S0ZYI7_ARCPL|nr:unnamed protein product [Arctia plantaginis]